MKTRFVSYILSMIVDLETVFHLIIRRPKLTPEPLPIDIDELEKKEMAKTRSTPENTWYQCYDQPG